MAFYNPQRVVFDPDTMTIKNAGAVGDFLYNASRDYLKRQDELAQQKAQQEQWNRQHQLENDKFAYQQNQDAFNNNLKLNEFNFNQTKWGQEHALKQRAQDTDEWYKKQNVAQGWGNLNVARQNANTSAMNAKTSADELEFKRQQQERKSQALRGMFETPERSGGLVDINLKKFMGANPNFKDAVGFLNKKGQQIDALVNDKSVPVEELTKILNLEIANTARMLYGSQVTNKQIQDLKDTLLADPSIWYQKDRLGEEIMKVYGHKANVALLKQDERLQDMYKNPLYYNNPEAASITIEDVKNQKNAINNELAELERYFLGTNNDGRRQLGASQAQTTQTSAQNPQQSQKIGGLEVSSKEGYKFNVKPQQDGRYLVYNPALNETYLLDEAEYKELLN